MKKYIFIILATIATSCSVKYSFTGASISPDVKTVAVATFPNRSPFEPTFGDRLSEALRNRFMSQTRLDLRPDDGDLYFEGEVSSFVISAEAITGNDIAAQNRLTITIRVKFSNKIDPTQDFDKSFTQYESYPSSNSEPPTSVIENILDKLVEDIFNASVANW